MPFATIENVKNESEYLARGEQCNGRKRSMPKSSANEMRAEYDFSKLKGGIREKYYRQAKAGNNLVLIDPDLAKVFPNDESVNRALRLLL